MGDLDLSSVLSTTTDSTLMSMSSVGHGHPADPAPALTQGSTTNDYEMVDVDAVGIPIQCYTFHGWRLSAGNC